MSGSESVLVLPGRANDCCGVLRADVPRSCALCLRLAVRAVLLGGARCRRVGGSVPVVDDGEGALWRGRTQPAPLGL